MLAQALFLSSRTSLSVAVDVYEGYDVHSRRCFTFRVLAVESSGFSYGLLPGGMEKGVFSSTPKVETRHRDGDRERRRTDSMGSCRTDADRRFCR